MQPESMMRLAAEAIYEEQAEDILVLEIGALTVLADYFLIATGKNVNHIRTIADQIKVRAKAQGLKILREEGYEEGRWVVLDLGAVIVHIFRRQDREYYRLEQLWGEGKVTPFPFTNSKEV